jgi:hypothetical protein
MRRRPIEYELVVGGASSVIGRVAQLVGEGWWLLGPLYVLNDTQVARELVKYEPLTQALDDGVVVEEY